MLFKKSDNISKLKILHVELYNIFDFTTYYDYFFLQIKLFTSIFFIFSNSGSLHLDSGISGT